MKRLHAWRRLLQAALFASLLAAPLARACGPYTLTFYEFGSLYYRDQSGAYVGIDRDVVDELARRSGCVINGKIDSRVRTWARLADGNLDMSVSGIATPEREEFAYKHVVTRALGTPTAEPDLRVEPARAGDVFLLCSDGLSEVLEPARIAQLLALPAGAACHALVDEAYAAGSRDNISAVVVRVLA